MLPLAVIQVPAALLAGIATAILFLTVFRNDPVDATEGAPLFATIVIIAVQGLFAQVAHAATIVSVAALQQGRPRSLTESLDPAFSRMGAILALVVILAIILTGAVLSIAILIGILLLPYVALRVGLSFEAMMLEGTGPWAAVKSSWTVTRRHMLRFLAVGTLAFLVVIGPFIVVQLLTEVDAGGRTANVLLASGLTFVQGILGVPIVAFLTTTTTLFYLHLRAHPND